MKRTVVFPFIAIGLFYVLSMSQRYDASAGRASGLAATAQPTQEATAAATAAGSSTKHVVYPTQFDDTCDLYLADLDGQNPTCIVKGLVSDLVSSGKKDGENYCESTI